MKHVFFTHSNITKVITLSIIKKLNLDYNNVLILSARNSKISGFKNLIIDDIVKKYSNKLHMPVDKNWFKKILTLPKIYKRYESIDNFIGINDAFIFYTPHLIAAFNQVIASNKNCIQINIIEEGTISFLWEDTIKKNKKIKSLILNILYRGRVPSTQYFDTRSFKKSLKSNYYILSDKAFIGKHNRIMVPIIYNNLTIPDNSVIYILDAAYDQGYISNEEFYLSIQFFLADIKNVKNIYIKFHPSQKDTVKKEFLRKLQKNKNVTIIPDDIIMEEEFLIKKNRNLKVYGNVSSLLIYAKVGGNYSKSYASTLSYYMKNFKSLFKLYDKLGIEFLKYEKFH